MSATNRIARLVRYSGTVQGVGFRYTAHSIARRYPIAGWVRNLPDGRVELLIEGTPADVDACLKEIRAHWGEMITDETAEPNELTHAASFEIRR